MLICEIDEKKDKVHIAVEGDIFVCTKDLNILLENLLKSGIKIECLVAALVSAVNNGMKQDEYNQCCEAISDLLKAIKDK